MFLDQDSLHRAAERMLLLEDLLSVNVDVLEEFIKTFEVYVTKIHHRSFAFFMNINLDSKEKTQKILIDDDQRFCSAGQPDCEGMMGCLQED